jgi:hypothetical protein
MMQESGANLDPNAWNEKEGAFGIMQWRGDRLENLKKFAKSAGTPINDLETQVRFAWWERNNSEKGNWDKVLGAQTPEEAAQLFDKHVERSSGEHTNQRVGFAKSLLGLGGMPDDIGALSSMDGPRGQGILPEEGKYTGNWFQKMGQWFKDPENSDELLAIGSGLLSTGRLGAGLGQASETILAQRQDEAEQLRRQDEIQEDRDWRSSENAMDRAAKDQPGSGKWYSAGNIELEDGTVVPGFTTDGQPGIFDAQGNSINGTAITRSNAGGDKGDPTFQQAQKTQTELTRQSDSIEGMDRLLDFMDTSPQGAGKLAEELSIYWKTLIDQGLTPEEIRLQASKGALQEQIGRIREEVVGPGVMTEPDVARIIAAMGGDMQSVFSNPEVIKERLSHIRENALGVYNQTYDQYETTRGKPGNDRLGYIPVPRYEDKRAPKGALSGVTPDPTIEEILKRNGV